VLQGVHRACVPTAALPTVALACARAAPWSAVALPSGSTYPLTKARVTGRVSQAALPSSRARAQKTSNT